MSNLLGKFLGAALIAVAGLIAAAPAAFAGGLEIGVETVGYRDGYYGRGQSRHERQDRWEHRRFNGRCAPWLAVEKARDHGLRRARIAHVGHRRVIVEGWRHHRYTQLAFSNVARCPTLRG